MVMESAAGSLMVAKLGRLLKDQGSPAVQGKAILCMCPNGKSLGQAAPAFAVKAWRDEVGPDKLQRSLPT